MSLPLEDYALIGDGQAAALISRAGSVDWYCSPKFDGSPTFAALLGGPANGRWLIEPVAELRSVRRAYRGESLVLDTEIVCTTGEGVVTDFMTAGPQGRAVVRTVECRSGHLELRSEFSASCDDGQAPMQLEVAGGGLWASEPMLVFRLEVHAEASGDRPVFEVTDSVAHTTFRLEQGHGVAFVLGETVHGDLPMPSDPALALEETVRFWNAWARNRRPPRRTDPAFSRSLIVLKSLAHPKGGIVAAPTTSLPQALGGVRNWDYRYCWLRDSALIASVFVRTGHVDEALAWRQWLLHVVQDDLDRVQSVYGVDGDRHLAEIEIPGLTGYENSRPVRMGNAAYAQTQLDALGWVMMTLSEIRAARSDDPSQSWSFERALADHIARVWTQPDHGVWEMRGAPQQFTDSKVMAWVALDRAIESARRWSLAGHLDEWQTARTTIHREVCDRSYNRRLGTFVQAYDSDLLDSNLLLMPTVGFLPATDDRVRRTIEAVQRSLMRDGLLLRYDPRVDDGLPAGQGAFLPCTFWLVECLALLGQREQAVDLFHRVASLANDVGLLSEQYDTNAQRLTGNFPQGFTHAALVNAALRL